jgi:putative transposase
LGQWHINIGWNDKPKTAGQKRFQNQGKNTLSSILGSYKSVVTKNAREIHAGFAWQSRFHDHIIRNNREFEKISKYIIENPLYWNKDKFNN